MDKMNKIIEEFNNTCYMFLDLMYDISNDDDIPFYKKCMDGLLIANKNKVIEQYILKTHEYFDKIREKNKDFFINEFKFNDNSFNNESSLLRAIKIQEVLKTWEDEQCEIIWEYLDLFCNMSEEYLKIKLNI